MIDVSDDATNAKLTDVKLGLFMGAFCFVLSSVILVNVAEAARRLASSRLIIEQQGSAITLGLMCVFASLFLIFLTLDKVFKKTTSRVLQFAVCFLTGGLLLYLVWIAFGVVRKIIG